MLTAFDIDGVLTEDEGLRLYRETDGIIGVVTSRSQSSMQEFIDENNLNPDFARSTSIKFITLKDIKKSIDANSYTYVGSWQRDLANWEYKTI